MYCPKCGIENPETGKFCRSCGTDLGNVSAVLSGNLPATMTNPAVAQIHLDARRRSDPNEIYADAIKSIIMGIGFVVVAMGLLFLNIANGHSWWWAMLFPAFGLLSKGVAEYMKYGKMTASPLPPAPASNPLPPAVNSALPAGNSNYISPESRFKTGDLVPPSVTDGTTRNLAMDSEGETMTLPKKP
ncbi:MAG: zinc-ribbon domain-containing protein [Acidobacteriota bacterium]